jgi:hypothetical protein
VEGGRQGLIFGGHELVSNICSFKIEIRRDRCVEGALGRRRGACVAFMACPAG